MKLLFLLSMACSLSITVATAQDIHFVNYQKGEFKEVTTEAEKIGATFSQTGENPTEWNYGTIEKASTGYRYFKFTNKGDKPLILQSAKPSCGCTVPSFPKEPIMPGEFGYIKVKYDTKRMGTFSKYITITTNVESNNTIRLNIKGKVAIPIENMEP